MTVSTTRGSILSGTESYSTSNEGLNRGGIDWASAIIGGIAGTILFDLAGLLFSGQWWDIPALLGEKTGLGMIYGVFGHFSNGILLAILYSAISPSLFGPSWLRVTSFMIAETVFLVWLFMFPLLGAGVAGVKMGAMVPIVSLLRHLIFGIPVWYFVHKFNKG